MTQSENTIIQTYQAEFSTLLPLNENNVILVLRDYKMKGRIVYEIRKKPTLLLKWSSEIRLLIGKYPFNEEVDVNVFVGKHSGSFYYKLSKSHRKDDESIV